MIIKLSFLLFVFLLTGCSDTEATYILEDDTPLMTPSQAAYPIPDSFEDLTDQAELIVSVELVSIDSVGQLNEEERTATLSTVEVLDVFEGSVSTGDSLPVTEPYYYNGGMLATVANYVPMEMDEPYLLFLSHFDGETWMIDYMGFGQYHMDKSIGTDPHTYSTFEDIRTFDFISDDPYVIERYESIREEVIITYY